MTNYFCDNCGKSVGAYESYIYGRFCSEECTERAEIAPKTNDDIIANLVRRVSSLERQVTELERVNKELSEVIDRDRRYTHDRIDGVKADIETWAQEHEKTKRELDDKIEMCIDDIVTLDERTQTESLTKFTQRGARI